MSKLNPLTYFLYLPLCTSKFPSIVFAHPPHIIFIFVFSLSFSSLWWRLVLFRRDGILSKINCQSLAVRSALPSILRADPDLHKAPVAFSCCCWSKWSLQELFANNKHVDLNNLSAFSLENRCLELFFGFLTEKSSSGLRQSFNVERVKRLCSYQDIWAWSCLKILFVLDRNWIFSCLIFLRLLKKMEVTNIVPFQYPEIIVKMSSNYWTWLFSRRGCLNPATPLLFWTH